VKTIPRFSIASRIAHWALAAPFLFLLASGLLLFVPSVKSQHVGGYRIVPLFHVALGIAFLAGPALVWLAAPGRTALRADLGRLFRVAPGDGAWLRYAGYALLGAGVRPPPVGKFNAGQKLNTVATLGFTLGLMLSGAVLAVNYFTKAVFSSGFVEAVYPLHDAFMAIALPLVAGHIYLSTLNPGTRASLRGMLDGRVDLAWARRHHPLWADEAAGNRHPASGDGEPGTSSAEAAADNSPPATGQRPNS